MVSKPQPTTAVKRRLYPIPEARQLLGNISHSSFYKEVKAGKIKLVKIGKRSFVSDTTIDSVVDELQKAP
jgi:hypothetical protein